MSCVCLSVGGLTAVDRGLLQRDLSTALWRRRVGGIAHDALVSHHRSLHTGRHHRLPARWLARRRHRQVLARGVVVRERAGTPFRQIFRSRNGAPANIVGHRWSANTEALRQIMSYSLNCPRTRDLVSKISKKISGGDTPGPLSGRGRPPLAPIPSTATRRARGC